MYGLYRHCNGKNLEKEKKNILNTIDRSYRKLASQTNKSYSHTKVIL